jgi:hypothetical protein
MIKYKGNGASWRFAFWGNLKVCFGVRKNFCNRRLLIINNYLIILAWKIKTQLSLPLSGSMTNLSDAGMMLSIFTVNLSSLFSSENCTAKTSVPMAEFESNSIMAGKLSNNGAAPLG